MGVPIAVGLMLIGIFLFLAASKGKIDDQSLQRGANIAGILAFVVALIVIFPMPLSFAPPAPFPTNTSITATANLPTSIPVPPSSPFEPRTAFETPILDGQALTRLWGLASRQSSREQLAVLPDGKEVRSEFIPQKGLIYFIVARGRFVCSSSPTCDAEFSQSTYLAINGSRRAPSLLSDKSRSQYVYPFIGTEEPLRFRIVDSNSAEDSGVLIIEIKYSSP